jgi:hypothetical protein
LACSRSTSRSVSSSNSCCRYISYSFSACAFPSCDSFHRASA